MFKVTPWVEENMLKQTLDYLSFLLQVVAQVFMCEFRKEEENFGWVVCIGGVGVEIKYGRKKKLCVK